MRVLIFGGGAVGLGLASCLLKAGAEVHIVAREKTIRLLRREGLVRTGLFGHFTAPPGSFRCDEHASEISAARPFDFILVCVKSFDSAAAATELAAHPALLEPPARIVLCQNGWGNHEVFRRFLPQAKIYSARVITGFDRPRENHVAITVHAEAVHIGSLGAEPPAKLEPLCEVLRNGDLPAEVTPHIGRDLWAKMLYNCSLNPLGAVFDVPYGVLAEWEPARRVMNEIHAEVFNVMRAAGYETHWPDPASYEADFYNKLVPATATHHSSTLQDIRAGKRTEIDALNGAILELGERHGLAVPVNRTVYHLVKFQEARHLKGR